MNDVVLMLFIEKVDTASLSLFEFDFIYQRVSLIATLVMFRADETGARNNHASGISTLTGLRAHQA